MSESRNHSSTAGHSRRSGEYQARSVDEAVQKALRDLGLGRDEVEVEIIKPGSRGLLGLLGEDAVVRVTAKAPPATAAPEPEEVLAAPVGEPARRPVEDRAAVLPEKAQAPPAAERPMLATDDVARLAAEALQNLLDRMGLTARVDRDVAAEAEAGPDAVVLNITGADLGVLIGRQGETLRDLQFVTSLIVSRHTQHWPNLIVDVEHYKSRRQKSLTELARRMADRVRASGQPVSLEPMPPHERRIVHLALRDDPDVFTESTGQDDKRRVVILPRK